jgi:oxepin-CoA hydrolase/3-oxo-5,6-dehydrosuberyl-CoA semialdehyde dehydrogenase
MTEVKTIGSFVCGRWHEAEAGFQTVTNPSNEEVIAQVSSMGIDFPAVLEFARDWGRSSLQSMTFADRAGLLKEMSKVLRSHRDELLELSRLNNGTTKSDGAFDIDGASGTLAFYASIGKGLGDSNLLLEGERAQLSREGTFVGRHVLVPRSGIALHINAFNFPAWGFAEKAACALLAGMPVISKPASATALVTHRCVELIVDAGIVPEGALQLVCGSLGDLLNYLGPQDVVAFTGSSETAHRVKVQLERQGVSARINVEADSLNAAILAPDVSPQSPVMELFVRDVVREITQKAGQKCTAVRRVLVPSSLVDVVQQELATRLAATVVGDPAEQAVTMGPLATSDQLRSAEEGIAALAQGADIVAGTGLRVDGVGAAPGKGYYIAPTLLRADGSSESQELHDREVFAPVATLIVYDGDAHRAADLNAFAGGTLVTSIYTDDSSWVEQFLLNGGAATGRLYVGSTAASGEAPGSGVAWPQSLHGGPGRAGGGEELGGLLGVKLYLQRLAVQGAPAVVELLEAANSEPEVDQG